MSTIRVVNLQHTDATVPNIVLESDGTSVFASGITISGATTLTVSGTAEFASGTAAAPKLTFIDDNDTGIYSPAANNLGITTNGSAALAIDSSQRVGIGTTSPSHNLTIKGTSPGLAFVPATDSQTMQVAFRQSADSATRGAISYDLNTNSLAFNSNSSERMRLDSSGRLLVGTTSALETAAGRQLQVSDANGAFLVLGRNDTTVGDGPSLGGVHFYGNDTTNNDWTKLATIDCSSDGVQGPGDNPTRLVFSTTADNASSPTERLRIDSSGRVGIGIAPTIHNLHIHQGDSGNNFIHLTNTTTGSTAGDGVLIGLASDESLLIAQKENNSVTIHTNNTERMVIDSSGIFRHTPGGGTSSTYLLGKVENTTDYVFNAQRDGAFSTAIAFKTQASGTIGERMRILSSGGITFNGDTSTNNALDDYEEGTWTPSIQGSTTAGTVTYSTNIGKYTKIGNTVFWEMYSVWSGGTGSGSLYIYGLPFTVQSASPRYPAVNIGYVNNYTLSANHQLTGLHQSSSTYLYFYQIPSGGGTSIALPYDAAASLILSGHYIVN